MLKNRAVLNSDTLNRYGFKFSIGALEYALEQKSIEGVPTCLGHDMLKPLGWTIPFGLYFEPGMCRLIGNQIIAEKESEQKFINETHIAALQKRYFEECSPYIEEFKKMIEPHLSEKAKYLYAGCVCYYDSNILERIFPKLLGKLDKHGLIYLSDLLQQFKYLGHGVFKHKDSELALFAHRFFRKSLSIHNNLNYFFIDKLITHSSNVKTKVRIALDRDLIGLAKTYHDSIELEYWRGPKFNNDVSKIKLGVIIYNSDEFQKLYYGISQTEFWWKIESEKQTFEVEELKEHPSNGIDNDSYGCRYVHSIFNSDTESFEHFDGAIRMYDTEKMLSRIEKDIKGAGKDSIYTKLFRIDGELSVEDWKTLICHYYLSNPLVKEYFEGADEESIEPHIIEEVKESEIEKLVPYSMSAGDGIRLLVSYHQNEKRDIQPAADRYISGFDVFSIGEKSIRVIENDVIEIKKALKRLNTDLEYDVKMPFACSEDLYWNIPTISHRLNSNLENSVSQTLQALLMIFEAIASKEKEKVASFSLCWGRDSDKQVTVSVMGNCSDIVTWLKENTKIPIEKTAFRNWLEKQGTFLNEYPIKKDKPALFEMVCSDGVLYIRRRGIAPEIKYQLNRSENGSLIVNFAFTKEQFELSKAYGERRIDVAPGYILKKTKCSKCSNDYKECEHSKYLDNGVTESVVDYDLVSIVWTDRRALTCPEIGLQ